MHDDSTGTWIQIGSAVGGHLLRALGEKPKRPQHAALMQVEHWIKVPLTAAICGRPNDRAREADLDDYTEF